MSGIIVLNDPSKLFGGPDIPEVTTPQHVLDPFESTQPPAKGRDQAMSLTIFTSGLSAGGRTGIFVHSPECGLSEFETFDHVLGNLAAKCMAVIWALQIALELKIPSPTVLTDAEPIVGWADGSLNRRSPTAREYMPEIDGLLNQTGARLELVPAKRNLATPLARQDLRPEVTDDELLQLRSGRDQYTRMTLPELKKCVRAEIVAQVEVAFEKHEYQAACLRWILRDLPVEQAIRKVELGREIGRARRAAWADDDD